MTPDTGLNAGERYYEVVQVMFNPWYAISVKVSGQGIATALKILGADLSPNGSIGSMYVWPCHCIARRGQLCGWTGIRRYADSMSTLVRREPWPNSATKSATSSTVE